MHRFTGIVLMGLPLYCNMLLAQNVTRIPSNRTEPVAPNAEDPLDAAYVPTMTFDVASVRESKVDVQGGFVMSGGEFSPRNSSRLRLTNSSVLYLVTFAYAVQFRQVEGIPREFATTVFNVEAKSDDRIDERLTRLTKKQAQLEQAHMLQVLLEERFKLKVHWEMRKGETYDLIVTKAGRLKSTGAPPKAEELKIFGNRPIPPIYQHGGSRQGFEYIAHGATTKDIAQLLSNQFGRPVADKTGLTGKYDFNLKTYPRSDDDLNPRQPLETAIQDELGLRLVPSKELVQTLIIDHIERPSEN